MTLAQAVFILLNALPRHYSDTHEVGRSERLQNLSVSIQEGTLYVIERKYFSDAATLAAAVIYFGNVESHFAYRVHAGFCKTWECDKKKAVGPWQFHSRDGWTDEYWQSLHGLSVEASSEQARIVATTIAGNYGICHSMSGAFGLYNTGSFCDSKRYEMAEKYIPMFANRIRMLMKKEL
jgi:hypothetical protein